MSFIDKYVDYASEFTDTPPVFHQRVALSVLSSTVNRNVHIRQGNKDISPNLWMVLIAPSSFYHKSTAVFIGNDILNQINPDLVYPDEFSHEKLLEIMSKKPKGVFTIHEFKSFMGLMSKDYNSGLKSVITALFDSPPKYTREIKGKAGGENSITIENPFLNILGASTLDWFVESLQDGDIMGGFLPRFLIVPFRGRKAKTIAFQPADDKTKREKVIEELRTIAQVHGEMKFSTEAIDYYKKWYLDYEKKMDGKDRLSAFYTRIASYALKFAMLLALDKRQELKITEEDCKEACSLADCFTREVAKLVEDEISRKTDPKRQKVEDTIRDARGFGISKTNLIRDTRFRVKDLDAILETLKVGEFVYEKPLTNEGLTGAAGSKKMYYWKDGYDQ